MKLNEQRDLLKEVMDAAIKMIDADNSYYHSAKFSAPEDWVRTWEPVKREQALKNLLTHALDAIK